MSEESTEKAEVVVVWSSGEYSVGHYAGTAGNEKFEEEFRVDRPMRLIAEFQDRYGALRDARDGEQSYRLEIDDSARNSVGSELETVLKNVLAAGNGLASIRSAYEEFIEEIEAKAGNVQSTLNALQSGRR